MEDTEVEYEGLPNIPTNLGPPAPAKYFDIRFYNIIVLGLAFMLIFTAFQTSSMAEKHKRFGRKGCHEGVDIVSKQQPRDRLFGLVNYMVFSPSPYTLEDLKSYKGMESYNQFVSGWVRDMASTVINNKHVVMAKVLHSQRLRDKPLVPWVIAEKGGAVLGAHCNCMAGLGEVCTHIGALLFAIEGTVKIRDSRTVTQDPAYWMLPSNTKGVTYLEIRNIDFTSAKTLKRQFDDGPGAKMKPPCEAKKSDVPETSVTELQTFFDGLQKSGVKSAILSLVEPYSDNYVPKPISDNYPQVLTELRDEESFGLNYTELLDRCSSISIAVSVDEADRVEQATREQANSKLWFQYRSGRITSSRMKAVCATCPNSPSPSLVKSICYPEAHKFSTKATKWGCDHEKVARDKFLQTLGCHQNVIIENSGLVISPEFPFIAASPDGIVSCECCGRCPVEIKCPFCLRDEKLDTLSPTPFLKPNQEGTLELVKNHAYYYQVQTQMAVTKSEFCYFVVWTKCDMHVEKILFDPSLWLEMCNKSKHIFDVAILPELVGKFFTQLPATACEDILQPVESKQNQQPGNGSADEETWCYCGQVEFGKMICCDNENCKIGWFHYGCIRMSNAPKGKWFCPDCKRRQVLSKRCVTQPLACTSSSSV